jgi:signal transduction histidine kinase
VTVSTRACISGVMGDGSSGQRANAVPSGGSVLHRTRDWSARGEAAPPGQASRAANRTTPARELHDVVAHHLSMISVQAEIARLTTPGMPTEGAKRLAAIGDTARTALTEMQRLLDVLRSDAATEPTRKPQPGLDQLNELIDKARDAAVPAPA